MMFDYPTGANPTSTIYSSWTLIVRQTGALALSFDLKVIIKVSANNNGDDIDLSTVDLV